MATLVRQCVQPQAGRVGDREPPCPARWEQPPAPMAAPKQEAKVRAKVPGERNMVPGRAGELRAGGAAPAATLARRRAQPLPPVLPPPAPKGQTPA